MWLGESFCLNLTWLHIKGSETQKKLFLLLLGAFPGSTVIPFLFNFLQALKDNEFLLLKSWFGLCNQFTLAYYIEEGSKTAISGATRA